MNDSDKSNGYEQIASIFIGGRGQNHTGIGANVVAEWSRLLPVNAKVLDLGCGPGVPISKILVNGGFNVYGVDASTSMVAAFKAQFPAAPVQCAAVEESDFFGETFDGVVAWGLFFLLDEEGQRSLIEKIAFVLTSGGQLLFTSPSQACSWLDAMTERYSISLGLDEYRKALEANGLSLIETRTDDVGNFYYLARKG